MHVRQTEIASLVPVGQSFVIKAQTMQKCCMKIMDMDRVAHDVVTVLVRLTDHRTRLDSPTRHPHSETSTMMIPAVIVLK